MNETREQKRARWSKPFLPTKNLDKRFRTGHTPLSQTPTSKVNFIIKLVEGFSILFSWETQKFTIASFFCNTVFLDIQDTPILWKLFGGM